MQGTKDGARESVQWGAGRTTRGRTEPPGTRAGQGAAKQGRAGTGSRPEAWAKRAIERWREEQKLQVGERNGEREESVKK